MALLLVCFLSLGLNVSFQNGTDGAIRQAYETGERALQQGDLPGAKKSFSRVLEMAPGDVGAKVNLGVVFMREQNWPRALQYLRDAAKQAPQVTGIRLNIGLAEYRQGHWAAAIPEFQLVLNDQPRSTQARRLLGLCYLFEERYAESTAALEPLWPTANGDLSYLYTLAVAAGNAGRRDLEDQSLAKLMETGKDSPLVHLLVGKAYIAHDNFDQALGELNKAAQGDPKLPLVHYNLGVVYRRKGLLDQAKEEFLNDISIEPGVAFNYDQLGSIFYQNQRSQDAEIYFLDAVKRDSKLGTSWFGLAKIYKQQKRYGQALKALDEAGLVDSKSASVHYLRAQILIALGRQSEAQAEIAVVRQLKKDTRDELELEVSGSKYRDPQLAAEPLP